MKAPRTVINIQCIPIARYDENDQQWRPSVEVRVDDQLVYCREYGLGFDEERFAMPYARECARAEEARWKMTINRTLGENHEP